jgi:aryl-alcohol dehydrogenase-like predicted oxidoreductase
MEYRKLGSTGLEVSELVLGTWRFGKETDGVVETDRETAHELLDQYADAGGNFIDTANIYGTPNGLSEKFIGEWLADRDREEYVVASKVFGRVDDGPNKQGLSRKHILAQIEGTLDRLETDYLDLYYLHRWDDSVPAEETLRTLDRLVDEGKVHHLGASTMAGWKLMKGLKTSDCHDWERFTVTQPLFHAAYRDDIVNYLEVCADQNLAVCPYSPLAGGFLTGKYERGENPKDVVAPEGSRGDLDSLFDDYYVSARGWHVLDAIESVAEEVGATNAQVALRWLMDHDRFQVVPIVGARTVDQLDENLGAVEVTLSEDQHDRISEARYDEKGRRWGHRDG